MRQLKIEKKITGRTANSDKYLSEVTKKKMLTPEEECDLILEYRKTGSREVRDRVVEANLRFVISVAKQYTSNPDNLLDYIQEGNIGLLHAIDKFDPSTGYKFISYAVWWIRQSIMTHMSASRGNVRIPTPITNAMQLMQRTYDALSTKLGHEPSQEDMFEELYKHYKTLSYRCSESQVRSKIRDFFQYTPETSLDNMTEEGSYIYELIPAEMEHFDSKKSDAQQAIKLLSKNLPKKDVEMLLALHGIGDQQTVITKTEIAEKYGIENLNKLDYLATITMKRMKRNYAKNKSTLRKKFQC